MMTMSRHPPYQERSLRSFSTRRAVTVALFGLAFLGLPVSRAIPATEGGLKVGTLPVGKILFLGNSITLHGPAPDIG
jgi:hypothetical protein